MSDQKLVGSGTRRARRLASAAGLAAAAVALAACRQQVSAGATATVNASAHADAAQSSSAAVAPAASATSPCSTTNLRISVGKPAGTGTAQQYRVAVTLRNDGTGACNLDGYPGMDLVGDGGDLRMPVARQAASYAAVRLQPGQSSSFALTYALETAREIQGELGAWGPNSVVITAPNSVTHQTLKWSLGPVVTTPSSLGQGTYLSPVGQ